MTIHIRVRMPMVRRKYTGLLFWNVLDFAGPAPHPGLLKELDARAPGLLQNEREIHWHLLIFMVFKIFSGLLAEAFRCKELPEQEQFP